MTRLTANNVLNKEEGQGMTGTTKQIRAREFRVDNGEEGVSVDISIDSVMFTGGETWFLLIQDTSSIEVSISCLERLLAAAKRLNEENA